MPASTRVILDAADVRLAIQRMAAQIAELNRDPRHLMLVGVQTGGVVLAARLSAAVSQITGQPVAHGELDVSMHRDDLDGRGTVTLHPTRLPSDITGFTIVLVDDVLFRGRTVRAALDALHDFGRPVRVQLAVLVDRGHRELPIKADFAAKTLQTQPKDHIDVRWAEENGEDQVRLVTS